MEPPGIAVIPDSHRVVIASSRDNKCRIYDPSLKLAGQIDDLEYADNVRYNAETGQAIVGFGHGALAFIDPQAGTKVAEVSSTATRNSFSSEAPGAVFSSMFLARDTWRSWT